MFPEGPGHVGSQFARRLLPCLALLIKATSFLLFLLPFCGIGIAYNEPHKYQPFLSVTVLRTVVLFSPLLHVLGGLF